MEDIYALEIHHIRSREDGGGDEPENLILVCSTCHSRITHGVISMADVVVKKRELIYIKLMERRQSSLSNGVHIRGNVKGGIVANVVKISSTKKSWIILSIDIMNAAKLTQALAHLVMPINSIMQRFIHLSGKDSKLRLSMFLYIGFRRSANIFRNE